MLGLVRQACPKPAKGLATNDIGNSEWWKEVEVSNLLDRQASGAAGYQRRQKKQPKQGPSDQKPMPEFHSTL